MSAARVCGALALMAWAIGAQAQAPAVRVSVSEITDRRTTGKFFAGAEVKLSVMGDAVAEMRGIRRLQITQAVDNTGRDLVNSESREGTSPFGFQANDRKSSTVEHTVKLANPARKATAIRDLAGVVEIYVPVKDPKAQIAVKGLLASTGRPLAAAGLRDNRITMTILTKAQFDAMKKEREKAEAAELEKARTAKTPADAGQALGRGLRQLVSGFASMDEGDLAFIVEDPDNRIVDMELRDGNGAPIKRRGRMSSGSTSIESFERKPDERTDLMIYVSTPASMVKAPFAFKDVALP